MMRYKQILFLFISVFCLVSCGEKLHPKDSELIEKFQNHKVEFNQLLQMFQEDESLGRVAKDFTRKNFYNKGTPKKWDGKEIEANEQRLTEYRILFGKLELSKGIEGYGEKDIIWFHSSSKGLAVTGSSKGYAYLSEKPKILVDNLDEFWLEDGKSFSAFKHIEGNWYLYFDYED